MGKRLPAAAIAAAAVRSYARSLRSPSAAAAAGKAAKTPPAPLDTPRNSAAAGAVSSGRAEVRDLAAACGLQEDERVPLAEVVSDCTRRWFQDALKEARAGEVAMQVLVGQMYRSGYGVNKNEHKARVWMEKASRYRSTVWKVSNKRPVSYIRWIILTAVPGGLSSLFVLNLLIIRNVKLSGWVALKKY